MSQTSIAISSCLHNFQKEKQTVLESQCIRIYRFMAITQKAHAVLCKNPRVSTSHITAYDIMLRKICLSDESLNWKALTAQNLHMGRALCVEERDEHGPP